MVFFQKIIQKADINFGDKYVKYVGRKASSTTATGNLNKHLAQQKEILEKILKD